MYLLLISGILPDRSRRRGAGAARPARGPSLGAWVPFGALPRGGQHNRQWRPTPSLL